MIYIVTFSPGVQGGGMPGPTPSTPPLGQDRGKRHALGYPGHIGSR